MKTTLITIASWWKATRSRQNERGAGTVLLFVWLSFVWRHAAHTCGQCGVGNLTELA